MGGNRSPSEDPPCVSLRPVVPQAWPLVRFTKRAVWLVYLSSSPPVAAVAPGLMGVGEGAVGAEAVVR
jgi:hypothetical protein